MSYVDDVAKITVHPYDFSDTVEVGIGNVSVCAGVIEAKKGKPYQYGVNSVTSRTLLDKLGSPFHPSVGTKAEGWRQLHSALSACQSGNIVRVVADDAEFPVYYLKTSAGTEIEVASEVYGTAITLGTGYILAIWPKDGDLSENRSVQFADVNTTEHTFVVKLYDKNAIGTEYLEEQHVVGIDPDHLDDEGRTTYLPSVLERDSDILAGACDPALEWSAITAALTAGEVKTPIDTGVVGGTPTSANWIAAWDVFRNNTIPAYLMAAFGNYDSSVLANAADIAEKRRTFYFFDAPHYEKAASAMATLASYNINSMHTAAYYSPYKCYDPWSQMEFAYGCSGDAVRAAAIGNDLGKGGVPGDHWPPAGESDPSHRGVLPRTRVSATFPDDDIDEVRTDMVAARLNPVIPRAQTVETRYEGGVVIDDALTSSKKDNYSKHINVIRVLNGIAREATDMARQRKFGPQAQAKRELDLGCRQILDRRVVSGALVAPNTRDPNAGTKPYIFEVTQPEFDLFNINADVCISGYARRIALQLKVIR